MTIPTETDQIKATKQINEIPSSDYPKFSFFWKLTDAMDYKSLKTEE